MYGYIGTSTPNTNNNLLSIIPARWSMKKVRNPCPYYIKIERLLIQMNIEVPKAFIIKLAILNAHEIMVRKCRHCGKKLRTNRFQVKLYGDGTSTQTGMGTENGNGNRKRQLFEI